MFSYDIDLNTTLKAHVPQQVIDEWRKMATAEDASPFLKAAHSDHPDDDSFALHMLRHGIRRCVQYNVALLFEEAGIGGTIAPSTVSGKPRLPTSVKPVTADEVGEVVPA